MMGNIARKCKVLCDKRLHLSRKYGGVVTNSAVFGLLGEVSNICCRASDSKEFFPHCLDQLLSQGFAKPLGSSKNFVGSVAPSVLNSVLIHHMKVQAHDQTRTVQKDRLHTTSNLRQFIMNCIAEYIFRWPDITQAQPAG